MSKFKILEIKHYLNPCSKLSKVKQSIFDQGEKSGKILAWCIKQLKTKRTITILINQNYTTIIGSPKINKAFREYYEKLHSPERDRELLHHNLFLRNLNIPSRSEERRTLGENATLEDISEEIKSMKSEKEI